MSTTSTSLSSLYPAEKIEARMRKVNLPQPVAAMIADVDVVGTASGGQVSVVKMSDITIPSGTTGENVEFPVVTSSPTDQIVTPGKVGVSFQLSREGSYDAIFNTLMEYVNLIRKKLGLRVDQDLLDLILGSSNTNNDTGNDLTEARLTETQIQFAAQNPSVSGPVAYVGTPRVIGDLKLDIQAAGGTRLGGDAVSAQAAELMGTTVGAPNGFQAVWNGVRLFQTTQAPTTGTDCNAAMIIMGSESAWAYRLWNALQIDSKWQQESWSWLVTLGIRFGVGIVDDEQQVEHVVDNAA